ncbi:Putative protein tag-52 [Dufourea novaeangliae]|uniref:Uncharacterized protein n=1 Tax=Dufourea novaeangliae TaxID=178035 RepID=A0A154P0W1_DUFNO|nr:Putative protein tag-52 [Dufourea novaeangliae]
MNSPISPQTPLSFELKTIINNRNVLSMRSRMRVLNSLNESNQKHLEEKEKNLRSQAVQEILTTEVTYLHQLEILMEFFIQPMVKKKLLDHILLSTLSENIKTLYNVSGELVMELKQDPHNIAGAFHKLAPFFKLYSVYAYDYEQVLSLLQSKQESNFAFKDFISKQESRPEVGRKLPSLLITPIQRVPRYKLLLQEVLQHTPNKHKEYNLLQVCLVEIEKAARHINALVEQHEEAQKLLKLQRCIMNPINLVKPDRKLIKQGALMRVSRRGNSAYRRYFVLLSDTLLYCKGDPQTSLTVCCVLPLNKCKVECVLSGGLFRVTCLNEILLLYSEKDDSNLWIEAIQNSIKKYAECRQTLRKDSSSRKPLRHNNLNLFPSENIPVVANKRKRSDGESEVNLDASRIMYLKKDNEADADVQLENNCFILLKRFKKLKNTPSLSPVSSSNFEQATSTLKCVTDFFLSIGSSLKEFFRFK